MDHERRDLAGALLQYFGATEYIASKARGWSTLILQILNVLAEIFRVVTPAPLAAVRQLYYGALLNDGREHVAVVVVGMLAEQIDPAMSVGRDLRCLSKDVEKASHAQQL